MNAHSPVFAALDTAEVERAARLAHLRAERDKLETETIDDLFCCKTERDFHYADEDLAAWDAKYGAELDALIDELGA